MDDLHETDLVAFKDSGAEAHPPSKRPRLDHDATTCTTTSSPPSSPHSSDFQSCNESDPANSNAPLSPSLSAEVFNGGDAGAQELQSDMAMELGGQSMTQELSNLDGGDEGVQEFQSAMALEVAGETITEDLHSNLLMEVTGEGFVQDLESDLVMETAEPCIQVYESHLVIGGTPIQEIESSLAPVIRENEKEQGKMNVAAVMAELKRERRRNVELLGRVSSLEAQLGGDEGDTFSNEEAMIGTVNTSLNGAAIGKMPCVEEKKVESDAATTNYVHFPYLPKQEESSQLGGAPWGYGGAPSLSNETMVNWMCREEVSTADIEKLNDAGSGDDDDDDDDDDDEEEENETGEGGRKTRKKVKHEDQDKAGASSRVMDSDSDGEDLDSEAKFQEHRKKNDGKKTQQGKRIYWSKRYGYGPYPLGYRGAGILSSYKKAPKFALTPMEVRRILESGVLALKNAQSHTMRKIIVFSCLCIRHGCEDFYELDVNHFTILQRGEPYKSSKDPGEHILYSHPSGRTKVFYPNRQNPLLCPVRIIDEEKEMRPAGATTPSCLFLCIKYGGRTRNVPQNQYVRQRMGRNKLKSFGPLMCQMALLVHVRTGSFFFKALGITLLFMAGFSDDQVRKETKYRNLDLLQKYHRPDEAAKGEQLFHPYTPFFPQVAPASPAAPTTLAPIAPQGSVPPPSTLVQIAATPTPVPVSNSQLSVAKKPPPLLVKKDLTAPLVSAKPKPSADRPYRRIPPLPFHLLKPPKKGRKPKHPVKPKPPPLGPHPFGAFPRFALQRPPAGFPPIPPPGWLPASGFPPPGAFPFPFPPFPPNPQLGSGGSPPPYFRPFGFPPFMPPPPPSIQVELEQLKKDVSSEKSGSDSGYASEGTKPKRAKEEDKDQEGEQGHQEVDQGAREEQKANKPMEVEGTIGSADVEEKYRS